MKELSNNEEFEGIGVGAISAEVGTGSVVLKWRKSDGSYQTLKTYTVDTLEQVPAHAGLKYLVELTGTAKAVLY